MPSATARDPRAITQRERDLIMGLTSSGSFPRIASVSDVLPLGYDPVCCSTSQTAPIWEILVEFSEI